MAVRNDATWRAVSRRSANARECHSAMAVIVAPSGKGREPVPPADAFGRAWVRGASDKCAAPRPRGIHRKMAVLSGRRSAPRVLTRPREILATIDLFEQMTPRSHAPARNTPCAFRRAQACSGGVRMYSGSVGGGQKPCLDAAPRHTNRRRECRLRALSRAVSLLQWTPLEQWTPQAHQN